MLPPIGRSWRWSATNRWSVIRGATHLSWPGRARWTCTCHRPPTIASSLGRLPAVRKRWHRVGTNDPRTWCSWAAAMKVSTSTRSNFSSTLRLVTPEHESSKPEHRLISSISFEYHRTKRVWAAGPALIYRLPDSTCMNEIYSPMSSRRFWPLFRSGHTWPLGSVRTTAGSSDEIWTCTKWVVRMNCVLLCII